MRLSEWTTAAPHKDSATPKVMAVVEPILEMLGCEPDPPCWVLWGDDPSMRYLVMAATGAGMVQVNVRVNVPGEGPRAGGKLIRWNRIQLGELAVEMQGGHRILSVQVEGQILRGTDGTADDVAAFLLDVFAAIDGRARDDGPSGSARGASRSGRTAAKRPPTARGSGARVSPAKGPAEAAASARVVPLLEPPKGSSS